MNPAVAFIKFFIVKLFLQYFLTFIRICLNKIFFKFYKLINLIEYYVSKKFQNQS